MRGLVLLVLGGCVLLRPPTASERPRWRVDDSSQLDAECVIARALVRKSGKQGIGIALELKSRSNCELTFTAARIDFADGAHIAVPPPRAATLPGGSVAYVWWPIAFDNNAAWNAGRNRATLAVSYAIGD